MSEIDKDWRIADLQAKLSTSKQSNCDLEDMLVALKEEHEEEVIDLERQLAEARDLVFTAYQEGWNDNRTNLDCWETHWTDSDSRYSLEQLKEKGDE